MASIDEQIAEIARRMASDQQYRATDIQRQITEIEDRKAKLLAERDLARGARERLANFKVKIGADFQCPDCWIARGAMASLYAIGSNGGQRLDRFRCRVRSSLGIFVLKED